MNLYIGNLASEVTDDDLQEAFGKFGKVTSAKVIKDNFSNLSRGFGFVEMPNNAEADTAMKSLNGEQLKGKAVQISEARPRTEKRHGNRSGGRGGQHGWK
jgi:RNA recognition motif-containing protein